MRAEKPLILLLFFALSVLVSWGALTSDGYFLHRDEWALLTDEPFQEYFLHLYKQHDHADMDFHKRIPELWIHYFIDYETYDKVKFTLLAFATLLSSFYVSGRLLENQGLGERTALLISAAVSIAYLINPFNTQIFLSYYPSLVYAAFPLFFYFLHKGIRELELRSSFLAALLAAFMFLMVVHSLLYIALSFLIVMLMHLGRPLDVKGILRNTALFAAVFFSCIAFILLPYLLISLTDKPLQGFFPLSSSWLTLFSDVASVEAAMLMDYKVYWWPYVEYAYPFEGAFYLLSFLFTAALLIHAVFDRNEWSLMALSALTVLFLLIKGNSAPFPGIYEFLNFNLPLVGWLLRVPLKFANMAPFFFTILFLRLCVTAASSRLLLAGAIIPYLLFLSIFSWPFLTGDMAGFLSKTDLDDRAADLEAINSIIGEENPVVMTHYVHILRLKDIDADILHRMLFLYQERQAYSTAGNWSGLRIAPSLGVKYLIASSHLNNTIEDQFEILYSGPRYTLFLLDNSSSVIHIPDETYLCYGDKNTVRSLTRDPPASGLPWMLMFPYSGLDFPEGHITAADYAVLTSSPPVFLNVDSSKASFFTEGLRPGGASRRWSLESTTYNMRQGIKSSMDPYFALGKGFAKTYAKAEKHGVKSREQALGADDLDLVARSGSMEQVGNLSFISQESGKAHASMVTSDLDLQRGSNYELSMAAEGYSAGAFQAELIIQDHLGELVQKLPVAKANGSFSLQENASFYIPARSGFVTLAISTSASDEGSWFNITSFSMERVVHNKSGKRITTSFNVQEQGAYDIYVRLLKGRNGGEVAVHLDDAHSSRIRTLADGNHFSWERIYSGELTAGGHEVAVEQLGGFNAVSLAYVVSQEEEPLNITGKGLVYRLTGPSDFYGKVYEEVPDSRSSTFACMRSTLPLYSNIEVPAEGDYQVSYAAHGDVEIYIDGENPGDTVHLGEGEHTIEVRPVNSSMCLDHLTLLKPAPSRTGQAELLSYSRMDPSTYKVVVNSTAPFFLSFGRGFNNLWIASVNGHDYRPVRSFGTVNAYYINETGLSEITIEYAGQRMFYAGALLGLIGLSASIIYVRRYG
jgi:hypothetical protein